jgi:hypothetical protein
MKRKSLLAILMAGMMLATIFGVISVNATDSGKQQQPQSPSGPTPILANVRFFVYEKGGLLGLRKDPIAGAKISFIGYIRNSQLIPYVRVFFTGHDGYSNWIEVFPYAYLYRVTKDGYNPNGGLFLVLPGQQKTVNVRLTPLEEESYPADAAAR